MQVLPTNTANLLASRIGVVTRVLLWIEATNRKTGAVETMGLWTGDDDETITVEGQPRFYFGAGGLINVEPLPFVAGLEVQTVRVQLTPLAPEVEMLIRGYETRGAPAQIHRAIINPRTQVMTDPPQRRWKGLVDGIEIVSPGEDEPGSVTVTIASNAIYGTRGLALKKSDESMKLRLLPNGSPDGFGRYAIISGKAKVKWGE